MHKFLIFLIGCCVASFYYWLAETVPKKELFRHRQVKWPLSYSLYGGVGGMVLTVVFFSYQHSVSQFIFYGLLYSVLFLIAAVDQHYFIIPDRLQLCLAALFIFYHWRHGTLLVWQFYMSAILMLLISLMATSMVEDGLGGGDVKLLLLFGYGLGFTQASWVLFLASTLALIYIGARLLAKKQLLSSPIPFGPFLVFAFFLVREVW